MEVPSGDYGALLQHPGNYFWVGGLCGHWTRRYKGFTRRSGTPSVSSSFRRWLFSGCVTSLERSPPGDGSLISWMHGRWTRTRHCWIRWLEYLSSTSPPTAMMSWRINGCRPTKDWCSTANCRLQWGGSQRMRREGWFSQETPAPRQENPYLTCFRRKTRRHAPLPCGSLALTMAIPQKWSHWIQWRTQSCRWWGIYQEEPEQGELIPSVFNTGSSALERRVATCGWLLRTLRSGLIVNVRPHHWPG